MNMVVNTRQAGGVTVFDLSGRLVAGPEGDTLCEALRLTYERGNQSMLLNCEGLTYVDSCGLGDLVAAYAAIVRRGGALRLLNPASQLRRLLALTRLDSLFEIDDDESIALANFNSAANAREQRKLREYLDLDDHSEPD